MMQLIDWSRFTAGAENLFSGTGSAMTIGVFDGVHCGHQALIGRITGRGLQPVIVTFTGTPKFFRHDWEGEIYSLDRKLASFDQLGAVLTILIDFSPNFSKLSGRDFIRILRERGRLRFLAVGGNFRCGYRLDTDAVAIGAMNSEELQTEVLSPVFSGGSPVSSSRIRAALGAGDLAAAAELLGRNFDLDTSGLSPVPDRGGVLFDPGRRISPLEGSYPVLVHERNGPSGGIKTEAVLKGAKIFIPFPCTPERIEFLN
ncbi:MAG: riboflavin biosynthesis protein RibF [Treponema sp.]|jgi:riboflavin kinase/FMN adenylyltransferase|nr:riboflavin biosynthesis protein RibF [Treponema sp.]